LTALYPILGLLLILVGVLFLKWVGSVKAKRPLLARIHFLSTTIILLLLLLGIALMLSTYSYQQLTYERPLAVVRVTPTGRQAFSASVTFLDGKVENFELLGDELYLDARLLKWHNWANLLGLHSLYRLDRIGGRYVTLADERSRPRTLFVMQPQHGLDLFDLRRKYAWLAWLVDARYGTAAFVPVDGPTQFQIALSDTGLIIRPLSSLPRTGADSAL